MNKVTFGIPGSVIFDMEMAGAPLPSGVHAPNRLDPPYKVECTEEEARAMEAWLRARQDESAEYKASADLIHKVLERRKAL